MPVSHGRYLCSAINFGGRMHFHTLSRAIVLKSVVLIALSVAVQNATARQSNADDDALMVKFAFVAVAGPSLSPRFTPIHGDTTLAKGQSVRLMVEIGASLAPNHVYVIYDGPLTGPRLLFPFNAEKAGEPVKSGRYRIPRGPRPLSLDGSAGRGTVYVLASKTRLTDLEDLLKNPSGTDPKDVDELSSQVTAVIRDHVRTQRPLTRAAERPVSIAGEVRNAGVESGDDISVFARELTSNRLIFRSYTIEHE